MLSWSDPTPPKEKKVTLQHIWSELTFLLHCIIPIYMHICEISSNLVKHVKKPTIDSICIHYFKRMMPLKAPLIRGPKIFYCLSLNHPEVLNHLVKPTLYWPDLLGTLGQRKFILHTLKPFPIGQWNLTSLLALPFLNA